MATSEQLVTQEVAVVIAMNSQNPSLLSEDFLKYSGIVPNEWQLSRQPVYNQQVAQLVFENGFSIALQADRVMFLEALGEKGIGESVISDVTSKYVETLKLADYQAFGVNFRSYVSYKDNSAAASEFINSRVLLPRNWQSVTDKPVRATINLNYELGDGKMLNLTVNEASIQFPEQDAEAIVLFAANFNKDLKPIAASERIGAIQHLSQNWQQDLAFLNKLVMDNFLEAADSKPTRAKKTDVVAIEDASSLTV